MFTCQYRGTNHEDEYKSDEHIFPSALVKNSYTLNGVYQPLNQYMSLSFEKDFHKSKFFREVQHTFAQASSNKLIFMDELETERGTKEYRYSRNGQDILCDQPVVTATTNKISVVCASKNGEEVRYELTLPFDLVQQATGSKELFKSERYVNRDFKKLNDYLQQLKGDPSLNPDFHNFLIKNDLLFKGGKLEHKQHLQEIIHNPVEDIVPVEYESDVEIMTKYFMKIAWTHTCKQFGREAINNPIGNWILWYLISGHLPDNIVSKCQEFILPDMDILFKNGVIQGKTLFWWKNPINKSVELVRAALLDKDDALLQSLEQHLHANAIRLGGTNLIVSRSIKNITPSVIDEHKKKKFHSIEMKNITTETKKGVVCQIKLFGGIYDFSIQVSNEHFTLTEENNVKINFV